jgi:hypothetical protein
MEMPMKAVWEEETKIARMIKIRIASYRDVFGKAKF